MPCGSVELELLLVSCALNNSFPRASIHCVATGGLRLQGARGAEPPRIVAETEIEFLGAKEETSLSERSEDLVPCDGGRT